MAWPASARFRYIQDPYLSPDHRHWYNLTFLSDHSDPRCRPRRCQKSCTQTPHTRYGNYHQWSVHPRYWLPASEKGRSLPPPSCQHLHFHPARQKLWLDPQNFPSPFHSSYPQHSLMKLSHFHIPLRKLSTYRLKQPQWFSFSSQSSFLRIYACAFSIMLKSQ